MKKLITQSLLALTLAAGVFTTQTASAIPISGQIDIAGGFSSDTGNINTATVLTFSPGNVALVPAPTGSFAGVPAFTLVSWPNPLTISPLGGSAAPLWTFMFGGSTYSFDLTAVTFVQQLGDNALTVKGNGIASITGGVYDPTDGVWSLTAQANKPTSALFSFSSTTNVVPEGGSTLALLGLTIFGLTMVRSRLARA